MNIKSLYYLLFLITFVNYGFVTKADTVTFSGNNFQPIRITPPSNTGISDIYVLDNLDGVSITYNCQSGNNAEWLVFKNLGGAYAEELTVDKSNDTLILNNPIANSGYIIRENNRDYIFWLVDYSTSPFEPQQLIFNNESGCEATILDFEGSASPIYYYSINGHQETLSRDISLNYKNQIWYPDELEFSTEEITSSLAYINSQIIITPPLLTGTDFILSGDRFQKEWGVNNKISTEYVSPVAVEAYTIVESDNDIPDNQINTNQDGLGGSAPFTATFFSFVSDGVVHYEWQMSEDPEFEDISYRFNDENLTYTFNNEGVTYIRFIGSNSDGSCETFGDVYTVSIGSSELLIPNVFSPNGDGVNDIWKVAYRSLIEFRCQIFDKHGHLIYHFDNPDEGWNGKNGSKFVSPGVYFYVIEAVGADGKKYKKSGDINILNSSSKSGSYESD